MKRLNLKIKHKFVLMILILMMMVSASMIVTTMRLSNDGKTTVIKGVSQKLEHLQQSSIEEFNNFTKLANEGIREASGLVAIDNIISIAQDNQKEFVDVTNDAIKEVGANVATTLESQNKIITKGLSDLLGNSTESMDQIMEFDKKSQNVLANLSVFNIDSLQSSSQDSLNRFSRLIKELKKKLQNMQDQNSEAIDAVLIQLMAKLDDPSQGKDKLIEFVMGAFEGIKGKAEKQKNEVYKALVDDFDMQSKVMAEELKLVTNKVRYAISRELENSETMQSEKIDKVVTKLLENQMGIQGNIDASNTKLNQAIEELKTKMPVKLKEKGDEAGKKIREQTAEAGKMAEMAQTKVAAKIEESTKKASKDFAAGIVESEDLIKNTLEGSLSKTSTYNVVISLVCLIAGVLLSFFLVSMILKPVTNTVDILKDIAEGEGDLTRRIEVKTKDEVGDLAKWFNMFIEKIQSIIKEVSGHAGKLKDASTDLSGISQQMSHGAEQTSSRSNTVAAAAEEMSSNMDSVAAAMEEAATNVNVVASGAEQMISTISEITQNTEKARVMAGDAVSEVNKVSEIVSELGRGASEIDEITDGIREISDQVNLLALNATIEAARAGEAGKGFAVVAQEIKDLAKQTAEATNKADEKLKLIQQMSMDSAKNVAGVSSFINEVNDIVYTIATAMEEQSITTKEISNNVTQASQGIGEVNENVALSSKVAGEIAKDISDVNNSAGEISNSSSQVSLSAEEMKKLAQQLDEMVGKFKV
jgi:methyl-accepting chemotaxis protein